MTSIQSSRLHPSPFATWQTCWQSPLRPALVHADGVLLLVDGRGRLCALPDTAPLPPIELWRHAPLPPGALRPSPGPALYIAEGGAVLRLRGSLAIESICETGIADDTTIEALGLDDLGAIISANGRCWRVSGEGGVLWSVDADWIPRLADGANVIATGRDSMSIIDLRTGALLRRIPLEGQRPFAFVAGRVWTHGRDAELIGWPIGGSPPCRVPVAGTWPRPIVDAAGRAHVVSGAVTIDRVDLRAAATLSRAQFDGDESWPMLADGDRTLVYRSRSGGLWLYRADHSPAGPLQLARGSLFIAVEAHAGRLFAIEEDLADRRSITLHCLS